MMDISLACQSHQHNLCGFPSYCECECHDDDGALVPAIVPEPDQPLVGVGVNE